METVLRYQWGRSSRCGNYERLVRKPCARPRVLDLACDYQPGLRPGWKSRRRRTPILVTDANGDGLNDIIMGSDHGYGLAWFEQRMDNGKRSFVPH